MRLKTSSKELKESEETYHLIVESSPTAVVLTDRGGVIVLVNRQTETLFGYKRKELLGKPVEILMPARFRARHQQHIDKYSSAPQSRKMGAGRDLFGVRKDGSEVPLEIGLEPIKTSKGVFVLAAIVDMTERKKSEEKFRLAVEAAPNAMILVDKDGKIVLANAHTERLFGYAQSELLGQRLEMLIPPRFRSRHPGYRGDFMADPQARPMGAGRELFGWHKEGKEIPVEIGLNPIHAGSETFVLAAVVDITERRELQRKLARSEALAAVGSMAAVMTHEIRNPLGSIVMAARSLGRGDLNPDDREIVTSVLSTESERLDRTLQDFLQYARPREPKREISDLNRQVTEIVSALASGGDLAKQVRMDIALDKKLPPFPFDPDQVRQVLWNIMLNAVQAMNGNGRLKVATAAGEREASLSVVDSGPGIDPKSIDKIFEPFFTTKKKGTGLGLAIAQRIIQAHGGHIVAENEPSAGARFRVLFPLRPHEKR